MEDGVKKPWLSKTLWLNAIVAVAALAYPPVQEWIEGNEALVMSVFAVANLVLRLVTKEKIVLLD